MKRPSFQFYPGDWQRNANLRRCSPAARGVWVDVMCLLHDSDEYGALRWPLKEIAQACGASIAHVRELVQKSVLKGSDTALSDPYIYTPRSGRKDGEPVTLVPIQAGPIWYSSRMVKDEYVRTIRGESTRFGEESGAPPKSAPKPPFGDGASSASTTAVNTSEAKASGGEPPSDRDLLFSNGVPLLTAAGVSEKHARSMLAGLAKAHGDAAVVKALNDCAASRPVEPVSWLQAALRTTPSTRQTFSQQAADIARTTVPGRQGRDPALVRADEDAARASTLTPERRQLLQEAAGRMRA